VIESAAAKILAVKSFLEEALMAKPRIFVSSTYYDLKYIRASLELFIESLGFDAII
jgi:hypothetical protein